MAAGCRAADGVGEVLVDLFEKNFRRGQPAEFFDELCGGVPARNLRDRELAGGDIHHGDPVHIRLADDRREVVVRLGIEHAVFEDRPRRDHAGDAALDDILRLLRVFELIADSDAIAFRYQPGDISINGVVRKAAHRHIGSIAL